MKTISARKRSLGGISVKIVRLAPYQLRCLVAAQPRDMPGRHRR